MEERETVALRDDEGNVVTFEHLMTVNYRHKDYVILAPAEPMEGVGEDEAVVLETTKDENGDTCYKGLARSGVCRVSRPHRGGGRRGLSPSGPRQHPRPNFMHRRWNRLLPGRSCAIISHITHLRGSGFSCRKVSAGAKRGVEKRGGTCSWQSFL